MSTDNYHQLTTLVAATVEASGFDRVMQLAYQANAAGQLTDDETQQLAELVAVRRKAPTGFFSPVSASVDVAKIARRSRCGSRPRSAEHRQRRMVHAAGGWLPPQLAASFTTSELAVLSVILFEIADHGFCDLHVGTIAWRAGVSDRMVRMARAEAERLQLLACWVRGTNRNCLANVITVDPEARELIAWLKRRAPVKGGKTVPPSSYVKTKEAFEGSRGGRVEPSPGTGRAPRPREQRKSP